MTFPQFAIYAVASAPLLALAAACFIVEYDHVRDWRGERGELGALIGWLSVGFLLLESVAGIWWLRP